MSGLLPIGDTRRQSPGHRAIRAFFPRIGRTRGKAVSRTRRGWALLLTVALVIGIGLVGCEEPDRPNVIVIMTDDQSVNQMQFLPRTRQLIASQGTTFANSFVNWPMCCPSRATFLTGQYVHNHGVNGNGPPPQGGYGDLNHQNTLPLWMQEAGYATGHIGKYLHGYGVADPHTRPPGWTEWYGGIDFTFYRTYDYKMNRNGVIRQYGHEPQDYQTDVLANDAVSFVNRRARGDQPFFLSVAPLAVHRERRPDGSSGSVSIQPAPRHQGRYDDLAVPRPPNYNEADVGDKPSFIRELSRLPEPPLFVQEEWRRQAEALLAVDEMVERIYNAVAAAGELDETVIIFTSDNGYFHGEHRVTSGKVRVYEPSIRVPLLVRGAGFSPGVTATELVANVDLAPTIVALGEASARRVMDGRSLRSRDGDRELLIHVEAGGAGGLTVGYRAVRTEEWVWVEYDDGQRELYDMGADPNQLVSRHSQASLAQKRAELAALLSRLRTCSGNSCRNP